MAESENELRVEEEIADLGFDDECLIDLGQRTDKKINRLCAWIIVLCEKLAAAERYLALTHHIEGDEDMADFVDDLIDANRSFRTAVATALAGLRAKLDVIRFFEQHKTQDDAMQAVTQARRCP